MESKVLFQEVSCESLPGKPVVSSREPGFEPWLYSPPAGGPWAGHFSILSSSDTWRKFHWVPCDMLASVALRLVHTCLLFSVE